MPFRCRCLRSLLTAEDHFHLQNKGLTNVALPLDNNDVTTKKYLPDLLKTKAGTNYVNNELAKKASQSNVNTALDLKADKFQLTALNNTVNTLDANKTNNADFVAFSQNIATQLNRKADTNGTLLLNGSNLMAADLNMDANFIKNLADPHESDSDYAATVKFVKDYVENKIPKPKAKQYVIVWAEENGNISENNFFYFFSATLFTGRSLTLLTVQIFYLHEYTTYNT